MGKIVVISGSHEQFRYWIKYNIKIVSELHEELSEWILRDWVKNNVISITNYHDLEKLHGQKIDKVINYGTYKNWVKQEHRDFINVCKYKSLKRKS